MSNVCVAGYAKRIIDVCALAKEARAARDMDAELSAHYQLTDLLSDHSMIEIIARAYLLTSEILLEILESDQK